jgi:diguanylate cyclase (GGDEF)-like protein
VSTILIEALCATQVAVCLCDETDAIRFVNDAFRNAFFPDLTPELRVDFMSAIASGIASRRGINLESMSLDEFLPLMRDRRRTGPERYEFAVDLWDGSWWWVSDRRLESGWLLVVASDISSVKETEFKLRDEHATAIKAAETDFLTGLPNRRSGMKQLDAALEELRSNRLPLSIAILDIDHFKAINDAYGHEAGDDVLVHFARAIRHHLTARDFACRLGGEEFLIIMPEVTASRAASRVQRLLRALPSGPVAKDGAELQIQFSAGVTVADHHDDLKSVLARADAALYDAKAHGRGRVEISRAPRRAA